MTRLVKRYANRKLYDTAASRYVSLEELAAMIRNGEDVKVVDKANDEDITVVALTQIISDEGRRKGDFLSSDLLHEIIRAGSAVGERMRQLGDGVDRFVKKSIDRFLPLGRVRDEMTHLRERLDQLEQMLAEAEHKTAAEEGTAVQTKKVKISTPETKTPKIKTSPDRTSGKERIS